MKSELLTLEQALEKLPYRNIQTLQRKCACGELEAYKIGNAYWTTEEAIKDFLRRHKVKK